MPELDVLVIEDFEGALGVGEVNALEIGYHGAGEDSAHQGAHTVEGQELPHYHAIINNHCYNVSSKDHLGCVC